jgi:hypothetical protein
VDLEVMVSERVRDALREIAGTEGDAGEPLVHAWGSVRVGTDDAQALCDCIDLADWAVRLIEKHGQERGEQIIRTYVRLLAIPATVETLQLLAKERANEPASET